MTSTDPRVLPVPDAALDELDTAHHERDPYDLRSDRARDVRAIAAPVLAAWVEQVATEWDDQRWSTTPRSMAKVLRDRLAGLDPDA